MIIVKIILTCNIKPRTGKNFRAYLKHKTQKNFKKQIKQNFSRIN